MSHLKISFSDMNIEYIPDQMGLSTSKYLFRNPMLHVLVLSLDRKLPQHFSHQRCLRLLPTGASSIEIGDDKIDSGFPAYFFRKLSLDDLLRTNHLPGKPGTIVFFIPRC